MPPHLKRVATLPWGNIFVEKLLLLFYVRGSEDALTFTTQVLTLGQLYNESHRYTLEVQQTKL